MNTAVSKSKIVISLGITRVRTIFAAYILTLGIGCTFNKGRGTDKEITGTGWSRY